jgi:5-(carboxyamino)imidazole ribonucleotide mutase
MPAKANPNRKRPLVGIIMGSTSDWETMSHAAQTLDALAVPRIALLISFSLMHRKRKSAASKSSSREREALRICRE